MGVWSNSAYSAFPVGRDTGTQMTVIGGEISPKPQEEVLEILLLQAQIAACQFMRAAAANAFSFSSGDKRVDKTSQPEHWAKLEESLNCCKTPELRDSAHIDQSRDDCQHKATDEYNNA